MTTVTDKPTNEEAKENSPRVLTQKVLKKKNTIQ